MVLCEECGNAGHFWEIDSYDGTPPNRFPLCREHAGERGFCLGCGHFCGGVEYYEFSAGRKYSYCQPCWTALNDEISDYQEDDDYYFMD